MSTYVKGIIPPDSKYEKMAAVWYSCEAAGIPIPAEVAEFFDHQTPDGKGLIRDVPHTEWGTDSSVGFEVEVAKIPKDVKILRFYNSY